MSKVIITCAITGGAHTPSMSPYLPITPEQIAEESIAAANAGAAIVHLHARNPEDGRASEDPAMFQRFLQRIKGETDAVVNISTGGGGPGRAVPQRARAAVELKPEMASLNMGSINFNLSELADKDREWKFAWEKEFLRATAGLVFQNTFAEIEWIMENVGRAGGTRFEFECYDIGHLYTLEYFLQRGLVKPPLFIQSVMGIRGAIGAHPEDLMHMKRTADRLFGDAYRWSVLAAGKFQMPTMAALMGSNVRVGLEDNLYLERGKLATSNAEQVAKIRRILEELGMSIASPDEARQMLDLKGKSEVGF
jgi:uncharacterized protein (DUF849 family)